MLLTLANLCLTGLRTIGTLSSNEGGLGDTFFGVSEIRVGKRASLVEDKDMR